MASHQVHLSLRPTSRRPRLPRNLHATAAVGALLCVAAGSAAAWAGYLWDGASPAAAVVTTGAVAAVAALLSSALAGHFLSAVRALTEAAQKAAAGDLEVRLPYRRGGGMKELVTAFNEMLANVASERQGLLVRLERLEARQQQLRGEGQTRQHELQLLLLAASSQLRAPALGIRGFANLIGRSHSSRLDAAGREHLARICSDAARMEQVIGNLTELASLESAGEERECVDSRQVLILVRDELTRELARGDIRIDLPASLPRVAYPPRLLAIVFHRLLGRVLPAAGDRRRGRVAVGADRFTEEWRFWVRGRAPVTGPPRRQELDRLTGRAEGSDPSALSLDILLARRIVELYGGRLWREDAGADANTFFFTIPHPEEPEGPQGEGMPTEG